MTYPTEPIAVREAAFNYTPNVAAAQEAYGAALAMKTVPMIVASFRALKDHAGELDEEGRRVLCGLAHVLNAFNFSESRPEALAVLQTVPETLPPDDPAPAPPAEPA